MPLKIIGAGFGRTGTASLCAALGELGYPCYHMYEVAFNKANKSHLDFWLDVAKAPESAPHDWEKVFANYTAAVDFPAAAVWRELRAAYPCAKVILTLHPKGAAAWYESAYETIYATERTWLSKVLSFVSPFFRKLGEMSRIVIWKRPLKGTMRDREKAIARYNELAREVRSSVPEGQLLVFSVNEGWGPLCRFLGVAVPATPFPNQNDRAQIKRRIGGMMTIAVAILAAAVIAAAGLAFAVIWIFV